MKKLTHQSEKNSGEAYDEIYHARAKKGVDSHDLKRWVRLVRYFDKGDLVDLGCLDSAIVDFVSKKKDTTYTGIDLAQEAIFAQRMKYRDKKERVTFLVENLYETPFQDAAFDYAVLGEVLEHLDEPQKAIDEAMRILKPGGVLAISTPLEEEKEPGAIDKDRHIWSFSEQDLKDMLLPYGEVKVSKIGSQYFPVYKYAWPTLFAYCFKK